MTMSTGRLTLGAAVLSIAAVAAIGSESWMRAGYRTAEGAGALTGPGPSIGVVGDERFWLDHGQRSAVPVAADMSSETARVRLAALIPTSPSGRPYDVLRVVPLPAISGEPALLLIVARDPDASDRLHRWVIEADSVGEPGQARAL
jgi:hypothetical protein